MKYVILYLLFYFTTQDLCAQLHFIANGEKFNLLGHYDFPEPVVFDQPVSVDDHPYVKLFKQYFNPVSFDAYRSFFLAADWPGNTSTDFTAWQDRIKSDKLYLQHIMDVTDATGQRFLIFQYVMESPQYSIYYSMILKEVNGQWKHINFRLDQQVPALKSIGLLKVDFLQDQFARRVDEIRVDTISENLHRTFAEKFNRNVLYENILPVYQTLGMSATDIESARSMWLYGDDHGMVDFISSRYGLDKYDIMTAINEHCGFTLFNFTHSTASK